MYPTAFPPFPPAAPPRGQNMPEPLQKLLAQARNPIPPDTAKHVIKVLASSSPFPLQNLAEHFLKLLIPSQMPQAPCKIQHTTSHTLYLLGARCPILPEDTLEISWECVRHPDARICLGKNCQNIPGGSLHTGRSPITLSWQDTSQVAWQNIPSTRWQKPRLADAPLLAAKATLLFRVGTAGPT